MVQPQYSAQQLMPMPPPQPIQSSYRVPQQQYAPPRPTYVPQQQHGPPSQTYVPQQQCTVQGSEPVQQNPYAYGPGPQQQTPIYDRSYGATQPPAYTIVRKAQPRQTQQSLMGDLCDTGAEIGGFIRELLTRAAS